MKKSLLSTLALCALYLAQTAHAEIIYATDAGFHIRVTGEVIADAPESYSQFLHVGEWWSSDHTWFGQSKNLSIEPWMGGCFCEAAEGRSAMHMTVSYVDPGKELRMVGGLGPLSSLGLNGAMSWAFEPLEGGGTRVVHNYRVTGYYPDGLKNLAAMVNKVQTLQVSRLLSKLGQAGDQ